MKSSLDGDKVSHAYIFHGPGGVGKKLVAITFAKALNCQAPGPDRPCGTCVSCKKIDSSNHPDVSVLQPQKEGSSIGIDSIRALIRDASLKPYEARKKVYIIDGANSMTEEASNALLKTFEEPPSDSVIILVADSLNMLLPTIVSRAQVLKFFALGIGEVKEILTKQYDIDGTRAHILAHLSSGRLGEALKYNDDDFFEMRSRLINTFNDKTFFDSDFDRLSKHELKAVLGIMLAWYRDILIAKAGCTEEPEMVNIDRRQDILNESQKTGFGELNNIIKQIISTGSYLEQNANPKIAITALALAL